MRKVVIACAAAASLLLAGAYVFTADATTGAGTQGLSAQAKHYSPVEKVGCKGRGPFCQPGWVLKCDPVCHCVRC